MIRRAQPRLSLMSRSMPTIMRLRGANRNYRTRQLVRDYLERLEALDQDPTPPARRRRTGPVHGEEAFDGWRVMTAVPRSGWSEDQGTVVYFHGGGWIHEAADQHWSLVGQICEATGCRVLVPAYPLIQSGGTARTVVRTATALCRSLGGPVVLAGDSAGGSIAMSAALALVQRDGATDSACDLRALVMISPALDLRFGNPEIDEVQPRDPWLVRAGQIELAERWIGDDAEDQVLNPFLGDLSVLPRTLMMCGTFDILLPDARLLACRAMEEGARLEYVEAEGQIHVYPLLPTPEGRRARRRIVAEVRDAIHEGGRYCAGSEA